jgi:glycosyltransferase involved in cell wall biosynthesis
VTVAQLGADHVLAWSPRQSGTEYALAFGQWGNKNVDLVLDSWRTLHDEGDAMPLVIVGLPEDARPTLQSRVDALGLRDLVSVQPWLSATEFQSQFTSAALVVFPSDYEGFGLPAVEAMRLGIPVVITPDAALLEVTGGLATVMDGWDAASLARAVPLARRLSSDQLRKCTEHATEFTWRRTASEVRTALSAAIAG